MGAEMNFWTCDRGHKHATEAHAKECNRRSKLGLMMPADDEISLSSPPVPFPTVEIPFPPAEVMDTSPPDFGGGESGGGGGGGDVSGGDSGGSTGSD